MPSAVMNGVIRWVMSMLGCLRYVTTTDSGSISAPPKA
jgi:hypothetical protein